MNRLLESPVFDLAQQEKSALLLARLNELTARHQQACPPYANILSAFGWGQATSYAELPYLAARLFKLAKWQSVPEEEVFKVLTSSGTTGAQSQIVLDRETAALQSKVLVKILQEFVGKQRLPMLLV